MSSRMYKLTRIHRGLDEAISREATRRLPDSLKGRIEEVANTIGVSVNAWLVRALNDAVATTTHDRARPGDGRPRRGNSLSGWAR